MSDYKRILWIDDLDGDLDEDGLCKLVSTDTNIDKIKEKIKVISSFENSIKEIISDDFKYDTIILDIDIPPKQLQDETIYNEITKHIDENRYESLKKGKPNQLGLIIYLFLLKKVKVPIDRICFCSANIYGNPEDDSTPKGYPTNLDDNEEYENWLMDWEIDVPDDIDSWEENQIKNDFEKQFQIITNNAKIQPKFTNTFIGGFKKFGLYPPAYYEKITSGVYNPLLVDFINKDKDYYDARMLVIQSCDYWKSNLPSEEEIPFNKIFFEDDVNARISLTAFTDLLNRIESLFTVFKPSSPQDIYYQALKELAIFHDDKARYFKLKKNKPSCYKYHEMMHIFRNWSAHNKFKNDKESSENAIISSEVFVVLWCIFLRVYFSFFENSSADKQEPFFYEKNSCECFQDNKDNKYHNKKKDNYLKILSKNKMFERICANGESVKIKNNKLDEINGISDLIINQIGYSEDPVSIIDILLLFFREFDESTNNTSSSVQCELKLPEDASGTISFRYSYKQKKGFKIEFKLPNFNYTEGSIDEFFYKCISYLLLKYLNKEDS